MCEADSVLTRTDREHRLADKALDILHHLARRGSVWPEASATAVRELRDRITQRASRHSGPDPPSVASYETNARPDRVSVPAAPSQPHCASNSGLEPIRTEHSNEQHRSTSSMGLPQEHGDSCATHSAARGLTPFTNASMQASGVPSAVDNEPGYNATTFAPNSNTNTPVFDFGSSDWSGFLQTSDTFEASAQLPQVDNMDPYIGFDIPFWLGQDQYWDMLHDRN